MGKKAWQYHKALQSRRIYAWIFPLFIIEKWEYFSPFEKLLSKKNSYYLFSHISSLESRLLKASFPFGYNNLHLYNFAHCLKISQNVSFECSIFAFLTNFCPIKSDRKIQVVKNLSKWNIFGIFHQFFSY